MNNAYLHMTILGWSLFLTAGYWLGFYVGRKRGRIDVVRFLKREQERGRTILVSDCDEIASKKPDCEPEECEPEENRHEQLQR